MEYGKYKDVIAEFRKKTNASFHSIEGLEAVDFELAVWDYAERIVAKENLNIEIQHVILTGSRARGFENENSDLDLVVDYRGDVKEDTVFNLLNEGEVRVNSLDVPIDINPIRPEETGSLEEYLIKAEKYLLEKAEKINMTLYTKWKDIAISQGYPLIVGKETVVFPAEYDTYFTSQELKRLEKIMLDNMNKPKVKDYITIKEGFIDELKAWDRNDFRKTFVVARTSKAMDSIGIADKEITLDAVKLNRIFKYHSAMTEDVIMQLPDVINDPVFILSSKRKESRIVAAGEVFDKDNNPVVVVMELEPKGKHGIALDEIKIASAYGKENIQNLIATSEMLYLTEDKEKINSWIKCTGLQLPFGSSTIDSTYIISQNDEKATDVLNETQGEIILEKDTVNDNSHTKMYTKAVLQEGARKMGKNNPISIWVGNLHLYNTGKLEGDWINLPMKDEELDAVLAEISRDGRHEVMIFDKESREDCQAICNEIGEYEDIHEVNLVAKLLGNEPHPAVELFVEHSGSLSLREIANLIYQEDEIPYYEYDFDGIQDKNSFSLMSDETKLGYTMIEQNEKLKKVLESTKVNGTSLYSYVDVNGIGRDAVLSGYVEVAEYGYLERSVEGPKLDKYTVEQINAEIKEEEKRQDLAEKLKGVEEPSQVTPKM